MPLLFFILKHYILVSKQPTYTCGLFSSDLMFMVVSWARAIMSISKKAWTFPGRPYYYILYFQKLIESPTTVRQKKGTYRAPGTTSRGRAALQVLLLSHDLVTTWARPGGSRHRPSLYFFVAASQSMWNVISRAIVLILPPVKFNSQLFLSTFFKSTLWVYIYPATDLPLMDILLTYILKTSNIVD